MIGVGCCVLVSWLDRWRGVVLRWVMMHRSTARLILTDPAQTLILRVAHRSILSVPSTDLVCAVPAHAVFILLAAGAHIGLDKHALIVDALLMIEVALRVIQALHALVLGLAAEARIAHVVVAVAAGGGPSRHLRGAFEIIDAAVASFAAVVGHLLSISLGVSFIIRNACIADILLINKLRALLALALRGSCARRPVLHHWRAPVLRLLGMAICIVLAVLAGFAPEALGYLLALRVGRHLDEALIFVNSFCLWTRALAQRLGAAL